MHHNYSNYTKHIIKQVVYSILLVILMGLTIYLIIHFVQEDFLLTAFDIAEVVATIMAAILVVFQLRQTAKGTTTDMLIDLNNYFYTNEMLMKVYEELEKDNFNKGKNDSTQESHINDLTTGEVDAYATFFENIYLLLRNHITNIEDVDALFGYRFFIFMNHPIIQEKFILPVSSSYTQVFELYDIWIKHRNKRSNKRFVVDKDYYFPKSYFKEKLYLEDHGTQDDWLKEPIQLNLKIKEKDGAINEKPCLLKNLGFSYLSQIMDLSNNHVNLAYYHGPSRNDVIESLHLDYVIGVTCKDETNNNKLIAFCIIVKNRKCERSLANDVNKLPIEVATLDSVVVDECARGNHLQCLMMDKLNDYANENYKKATLLVGEFHPDNVYSRHNFEECGYEIDPEIKNKYNSKRCIAYKKLIH